MDGNLAMANILEIQCDHILRLDSIDYSFNSVIERKHTIDLNEVIGFNIEYRLEDNWYIEVIAKNKNEDDTDSITYFLDGLFNSNDIRMLMYDNRCSIYNIRNMCGNNKFNELLKNILI